VRDISVTTNGAVLAEGEWFSTSTGETRALDFSDGSTITLNTQSGIRVQNLTPMGAHLLLERGALDANVYHRKKTHWQLDVGPYIVTVTGTRFTASWDPETGVFNLEMLEGTVDVSGPMIPSGKSLESGETMIASLSSGRLEFRAGQASSTVVAPAVSDDAMPAEVLDEMMSPPPDDVIAPPVPDLSEDDAKPLAEKVRTKRGHHSKTWKNAAKAGDFRGAIRTVTDNGIQTTISTASATDLLALGDAARHTGDTKLATKFYKAALHRFGGSPEAVRAVFSLGLMAFDQKGAYLEAAGWFSQIARNQNERGLLVRESSGRLIESLQKGGESERAAKAAKQYLSRFPEGPHSDLAKRLTK
jgi:hypothetical protein